MLIYIFIYFFLFMSSLVNGDKIRGINIGGWLVLEPWITPSLFYQFLGSQNKIGMDMYSFCDILGPKEANRQLKKHWETWISEQEIQLLISNNINLLRIPIGDWMYLPYGPFAKTEDGVQCTDGAIEMLDTLFLLAEKHNIKILLDLHGVKGSQNGFDNSGESRKVIIDKNKFTHWETREANWVGEFNSETKEYISFDNDSIQHSKDVLYIIINKYYNYPALYGLNILNEPWEFTPEIFLKEFYQDIFNAFVKVMSNDKVFIIHDSFRSDIWRNFEFIDNTKNITILIDTHQYTAWNSKYESFETLVDSATKWQSPPIKYKYVIGEWSLAIDNCEMWLNGFMDNVPNYPLFECTYAKCPKYNLFKSDLLRSKYGPFGTGVSYPIEDYQCPVSISLQNHFNLPTRLEKSLAKDLFEAKAGAFEKETAGWIFWNFKTESSSYQWDYLSYIKLTTTNNNINNINKTLYNDYYDNVKNNFILTFVIILMICSITYLYRHLQNLYNRRDYHVISDKDFDKEVLFSI